MLKSLRAAITLDEVWNRRTAPHYADQERVRRLAEELAADPDASPGLLCLAWCTLAALCSRLQWPTPNGAGLERARAASRAAADASEEVLDQLGIVLQSVSGAVLLLGDLASVQRLLGSWDVLPAEGVVVVPLDAATVAEPSGSVLRAGGGIRWAAPGRLARLPLSSFTAADVRGRSVYLPPVPIIAARSAPRAALGVRSAALLFTLALCHITRHRLWADTRAVARDLGVGRALDAAVIRLGLGDPLNLSIPMSARLGALLGRLRG